MKTTFLHRLEPVPSNFLLHLNLSSSNWNHCYSRWGLSSLSNKSSSSYIQMNSNGRHSFAHHSSPSRFKYQLIWKDVSSPLSHWAGWDYSSLNWFRTIQLDVLQLSEPMLWLPAQITHFFQYTEGVTEHKAPQDLQSMSHQDLNLGFRLLHHNPLCLQTKVMLLCNSM